MAAYETVWWGARNGRSLTRSVNGPDPETDAITVATLASSSSSGGSMPGTVLASSVFPEPGGPIMTMLCPPARASSRPRRASICPRTSARSGPGSGPGHPNRSRPAPATPSSVASAASSTRAGRLRALPRRFSRSSVAASDRVEAPATSIRPASPASVKPSDGTTTRPTRRRARAATIGRRPGIERSSPPRDNSPRTAHRPLATTCSDPTRIPSAIARSSEAPLLRSSAGARFTVIRRGGYS